MHTKQHAWNAPCHRLSFYLVPQRVYSAADSNMGSGLQYRHHFPRYLSRERYQFTVQKINKLLACHWHMQTDQQQLSIDACNQKGEVSVSADHTRVYSRRLLCSGLAWEEPQTLISGMASPCHTEWVLASWSLRPWLSKILQSVSRSDSSSVPSSEGTSKWLWSSQLFWSNFSLVFNCKLLLTAWPSVTFNKCFNGNRHFFILWLYLSRLE